MPSWTVLAHLSGERLMRRQAEDPVLSWFARQFGPVLPPAVRFEWQDFDGLRDRGFSFVVLHKDGWPGARWKLGREALWAGLGKPVLREGDDWICWALGERR